MRAIPSTDRRGQLGEQRHGQHRPDPGHAAEQFVMAPPQRALAYRPPQLLVEAVDLLLTWYAAEVAA
jgi:hypothetical protein